MRNVGAVREPPTGRAHARPTLFPAGAFTEITGVLGGSGHLGGSRTTPTWQSNVITYCAVPNLGIYRNYRRFEWFGAFGRFANRPYMAIKCNNVLRCSTLGNSSKLPTFWVVRDIWAVREPPLHGPVFKTTGRISHTHSALKHGSKVGGITQVF